MSTSSDPGDDPPISRSVDLWRRHVSDDAQLLDRLLVRYREKHRRYHNVSHVASIVGFVDDLAMTEPTADLGAVIAAAWYHDAVYEPASPANERASARLARRDLTVLGWSEDRASHVADMIAATTEHREPPDVDHAVLFDADLSILGSEWSDYVEYVDAVRAEYGHVDDEAWTAGRREVLQGIVGRDAIYATPTGRDRWESAARTNIRRELDSFHSD